MLSKTLDILGGPGRFQTHDLLITESNGHKNGHNPQNKHKKRGY